MTTRTKDESRSSLRLASLNLLNSPSRTDERRSRLVEELKRVSPDVVLFQEVIDPIDLKDRLHREGYVYWTHTEPYLPPNDPLPKMGGDGLAVASKIPLRGIQVIDLGEGQRPGLHAEILAGGRKVHLFTAHFAWGSQNEGLRLLQAMKINGEAERIMEEEPHSLVLFGGDLNSDDGSRTVRYLHGLDLDLEGKSTFWTDAYRVAGSPQEWPTTDQARGTWGPVTAAAVGVAVPELLPARRIDYLLSHGWRHGKAGSPLSYERFGMDVDGLDLSDHYGLVGDFLL